MTLGEFEPDLWIPERRPGPGKPARVFTGATGRLERDRGSTETEGLEPRPTYDIGGGQQLIPASSG
jgi:hypothetical protein